MSFALAITVLMAGAEFVASDDVVATVDDVKLRASDLREYAGRPGASRATVESLVEQLVNDVLMAREARRRGLDKDATVTEAGNEARRRAAANRLVEREIAVAEIDDDQLRQLYHAGADTAKLQMVVLGTQGEAEEALERLRAGGDLGEEAKHSYDPSGVATGGDLGLRTRAQLDPAAAEVVFSAPLGKFVGPVKLALGFAVLKVLERRVGDEAGFKARRPGLLRFAKSQVRAMGRRHYVDQLRKEADVVVDEPFLRSTGTRIDATPEEAAHAVATIKGKPLRYDTVLAEMRRVLGRKTGGHLSGTGVKREFTWALVDRVLLEQAALSRGHGNSREARLAERAGRRDALVRLYARRIRSRAKGDGTSAVRSEIQRLRSGARIEVHQAALERALEGTR